MHLVMRQWETMIAIFPTIPHFIILSYIKKKALPEIYFLARQALVVLNVTLSKRARERGL